MRVSANGWQSLAVGTSGIGARRGTTSRRAEQVDARRMELLESLEALFLAEGFEHLTVNDLAGRLQCSKSTLYNLAPSREQLVLTVVKHFFRKAAATIEMTLLDVHEPRARIATYLSGVGTAMRRGSTEFVRDMTNYAPTEQVYLHNSFVAAERVGEMIRDGVQMGVFREVNAAFAAQVVARAITGIQSGDILQATGMSSGDAFTELAELLVHGLTAK